MIVAPIITIVSGLVIAALLIKRNIDLQKGKIFYNGDGLLEFSENSKELFIYIKKVFKHLRKVFIQYTFHFFVRVLYYLRNFLTLYIHTLVINL